MKVTLAYEHHFFRGPDGHIYTSNAYPYPFWQRYLTVFDEVEVVARVGDRTVVGDAIRSDGPGVSFAALPDYVGIRQLLCVLPKLVRLTRAVSKTCEASILRLPGAVGTLLWRQLKRERKAYGAQIVGDPTQSMAGLGLLEGRMLRSIARRQLSAQVGGATCTTFVTRKFLQRRYPPATNSFTTSVSDVEIPDEIFEQPAAYTTGHEPPRLAFVGALSQRYKGLDVLLRALASTHKRGTKTTLSVVGDGRFRPEYESLAHTLKVESYVTFLGNLPAHRIFEFLRTADLFIHPALTEGLPRVLVEAMAVGVPCIGTDVGGVPELLDKSAIVRSNDPNELTDKIVEVLNDPKRLEEMSTRNRKAAWEYRASARDEKLHRFYREVLKTTR